MARPEAKLKELKAGDLKHQVGARGDLIVTVNRRSERRIIPYGDQFLHERLPVGSRVIYAPPPLDELPDADQAIRYALLRPENADPLFARLNPNLRVTIAIDDLSVPLPSMRRPDVRERILNQIMQTLADYGVDDVHLVIATGLHRRMTESEIRLMVGERAFKQFWPDRLYSFDVENRVELAMLGKTERNEQVWLSKRAAESDLLIAVKINSLETGSKHCSFVDGLTANQNLISGNSEAAGTVVREHLNVFAVEATLNTRCYGATLDFLHRNEDQFTDWDRTRLKGLQWALANMGPDLRRQLAYRYGAPYGMTGVWAGDSEVVHQNATARAFQQHAVPIKGQTDVLIVGVPFATPHSINSISNPLLVANMALGNFFNLHRGKPLVREGGVMIVSHPLRDEFHPEHHPSHVEFFHRCLAETDDSGELEKQFQAEFAGNPTYLHMYRYGHAYHGVHPFHLWHQNDAARKHLSRVISAGCEEPEVAARLGWESADTLDEAIALATAELGRAATITYLHAPPMVIADVE